MIACGNHTMMSITGVAIPFIFRVESADLEGIPTPLRPQARAERNRRFAAALSAELWRTGSE